MRCGQHLRPHTSARTPPPAQTSAPHTPKRAAAASARSDKRECERWWGRDRDRRGGGEERGIGEEMGKREGWERRWRRERDGRGGGEERGMGEEVGKREGRGGSMRLEGRR